MPTQVPQTTTVNTGKYSWWREGPTAADFIHEEVTPNFFNKAITYVSKEAKSEKPFFLYLALPSPHTPILPSKEWQDKSGLNPYGDFVMMIDSYVGKLLKTIKDSGIEQNTLVIFTSDNGCSPAAKINELTEKGHFPSERYRGHKADIFEGGHRVPFIAKWPALIPANTVSNHTICTTDFMATCAEIAQIPLKENEAEDSFSMIPIFKNPSQAADYKRTETVHHSINGSFALRKGKWKLIFAPGSAGWSAPKPKDKIIASLPKYQLYNLDIDPAEKNNLYLSEKQLAISLTKEMKQLIEQGRSTPGSPQKNDSPLGNKEWKQISQFYE